MNSELLLNLNFMTPYYMLAAAAAEEGPLGEITRQFGWHGNLFISQVIVFAIVVFALNKFAYKPILQLLEDRHKRIEESLANAERIKTELAEAEAARKQIMEKANTQANQLIEEARSAAAKVKDQETQKAISQAEQIIAKAREAAQADHERMLAELKSEVGRMVVQTTAMVAGKILTDEDQKRLVEEANKQIAA
jgi:F-type H+-transporting ATPase subunit b